MDYVSEFMLNTIDDDNYISIGVEDEVTYSMYSSELPAHTSAAGVTESVLDDPLQMLNIRSRDVFGKEFLWFSVWKDDLRRDKNGLITVHRWVCSKEGFQENKYVE
ncbi:hypothetical protein ACOSQ3_007017 [Xanthoceras sorbifolium]